MASVCNKLEKLPPPAFVTTLTLNKRSVLDKWWSMKRDSNYAALKEILVEEISLLSLYVDRKGTQLRLEKALMLTQQILKISMRWKTNEFYSQLLQFEYAIGDIRRINRPRGRFRKHQDEGEAPIDDRLPSAQWATWILYLAMRDAILLAKIAIECENTVKYWLGLISSGHHWGDSLIISSVLSRLWFAASKAVSDFARSLYPALYQMCSSLQPNSASKWPSNEFIPPISLIQWIRKEMKLPFRHIMDRSNSWSLDKTSKKRLSVMDRFLRTTSAEVNTDDEEAIEEMSDNDLDMGIDIFDKDEAILKPDEEDLGTAFTDEELDEETNGLSAEDEVGVTFDDSIPIPSHHEANLSSQMPLSDASREGESEGISDLKIKKEKGNKNKKKANVKREKKKTSNTAVSEKPPWRKFYLGVNTLITSESDRKILAKRCSRLMKVETNDRVKLKLKKLKKKLLACSDDNVSTILVDYDKLRKFINKKLKS